MLRVSFEKCGGIGTPSALFQVPAFVEEPDLMDDDSVSRKKITTTKTTTTTITRPWRT
jgi:hypothetical protein